MAPRDPGVEGEPHDVLAPLSLVADLVQELLHHPQTAAGLGFIGGERRLGFERKAGSRVVDRGFQFVGGGSHLHMKCTPVFAVAVDDGVAGGFDQGQPEVYQGGRVHPQLLAYLGLDGGPQFIEDRQLARNLEPEHDLP